MDRARLQSATILILESERPILELLRCLLEHDGSAVIAASSGSDALVVARAHRGPIHLLVADINAADEANEMDDVAVAFQLIAMRPEMKVLYMTADSAQALRDRTTVFTDDNLLAKPFSRATLRAKVDALLNDCPA